MPFFPEDEYAASAEADNRSIDGLIQELRIVHEGFMALYKSFTDDMLARDCIGFKGKYSVASMGFMLPGHQRWHFDIIRTRYLPLLHASVNTGLEQGLSVCN